MDTDFKQLLETILSDDTLKKTLEQTTAIRDGLYEKEHGVCLGCNGPLVKEMVDGVDYFCHTNSDTIKTCTYTDPEGMVPDWAFFANAIFEE